MPQLDHKGPDGKGPRTGRGLGKCRKNNDAQLEELGKGRGQKRHSGGGEGKGQRLKSSKLFNKQKENTDENCATNEE